MKTVIRKASEIVVTSAALYRELAGSALRLVPTRRQPRVTGPAGLCPPTTR